MQQAQNASPRPTSATRWSQLLVPALMVLKAASTPLAQERVVTEPYPIMDKEQGDPYPIMGKE